MSKSSRRRARGRSTLMAGIAALALLAITGGGGVIAAENIEGGLPAEPAPSPGEASPHVFVSILPHADPEAEAEAPQQPRPDHVFPLTSKPTYGDGLDAGRGHRGQDLLTKCGKPVLAARRGRVRLRDYHGAAGHYLAVDGRGTSREYVYQHLQDRGMPREGERVRAGERIGYVGTIGNASTCHLHFEIWTAPGSYIGGTALDPTPMLERWEKRL